MKKPILCAAILCLAAMPSLGQEAKLSEAEIKAKLAELQKTIDSTQQDLKSVKDNRTKLLIDLEINETEIGELQDKVEDIKQQLGTQEQSLRDLQRQKNLLLAEQRSEKKHVAQQVKAVYQLGRQSNLKLLLNQNGPEKVSRMLKYYDYMLAARTDQIQTYQTSLEQLAAVETDIINTTQALARNRNSLEQQYQALQTKQSQRQQTLALLERSITDKDQQLKQLTGDQQSLEALLSQVATAVKNMPFRGSTEPFAQARGKLSWPVQGKIANRFGSYRIANKLKWDGVMITAEAGSEVRAIHAGRVVVADYLRGQGLLLILDHGGGFLSIYAHNRNLHKTVGDWVEGGELIARVGNSGGQSEAGLYFEIRQDGKPVNPSAWCA